MKRLTLIIMLLIFAMSTSSCKGGDVVIAQKPLYKDASCGWSLWTAMPGDVVVYHYYERPKQVVQDHGGQLPDGFGAAFEEMSLSGASSYYAFVLTVPEGHSTFWHEDAIISMTYAAKGTRYETMSEDLFVIQKCDLIIVRPQHGFLQIPSSLEIFETPNERPVVFARFNLAATPDSILHCAVMNVQCN
jgi:hypothetical protein